MSDDDVYIYTVYLEICYKEGGIASHDLFLTSMLKIDLFYRLYKIGYVFWNCDSVTSEVFWELEKRKSKWERLHYPHPLSSAEPLQYSLIDELLAARASTSELQARASGSGRALATVGSTGA
jgi:hypothetical protein